MKTILEKEKKLKEVINKLKNLEISKLGQKSEINNLEQQKNQLEIEKLELLNKFNLLEDENKKIRLKFEEFKKKEINEKKKRSRIFR